MKNILAIYVVILYLTANYAVAQQYPINEAKEIVEEIYVTTDREVYCVNEQIYFKAFNKSPVSIKEANWSNVLYLEILSFDGMPVLQQKFLFDKDGANGALFIPDKILTGNYYLRVYTKWMRNFCPEYFSYTILTIINPFNNDVVQPLDNYADSETIRLENIDMVPGDIVINTNKEVFKKREGVELSFSNADIKNLSETVAISVVKKGGENRQFLIPARDKKCNFLQEYIPETRTLSLSGKVFNERTSKPMPFLEVNLTIFKDSPEFLSTLTTANGNFYFDLYELQGEYETFISAGSGLKKDIPVILIDNDFSAAKVSFPFIPLNLEGKTELLNEISVNSQLSHIYKKDEKNFSETIKLDTNISIFGRPDFIVKFDEFIKLPTLEEYFRELMPYAYVRTEKGEKKIRLRGDADLDINEPLILVDMVHLTNTDEILKISPQQVDRIEVINSPYIRGSVEYGGIISIFSKGGDFAGVNLPPTGRFLKFKMLKNKESDLKSEPFEGRIPDLRNCLFWKPSVKISGSETRLSFLTGDVTGEFQISVIWVDDMGHIKLSGKSFFVK